MLGWIRKRWFLSVPQAAVRFVFRRWAQVADIAHPLARTAHLNLFVCLSSWNMTPRSDLHIQSARSMWVSSAAGNGVFVGRKGYLTCCVAAKSTVTTVPLSKNFCITARCFCRRSSKTPPLNIFIKHAALFIPCHDLYRKDWNALNVTWRLMWHVFNATRYLLFVRKTCSLIQWWTDVETLLAFGTFRY